jgi:hypothetical protein
MANKKGLARKSHRDVVMVELRKIINYKSHRDVGVLNTIIISILLNGRSGR